MSKKKIATVWLAGCSGCHMSLLDIDERILEVAKLADIIKSPVVDGKELPPVDVTIVEGAVASDEHREELVHIRKQSKVVVSLGDCAVTGNVASLRNGLPVQAVIDCSYKDEDKNAPGGALPNDPDIQKLLPQVKPLHEVVRVDYYIPGCPPSADLIFYVLNELLNDRVPSLENGKVKYG